MSDLWSGMRANIYSFSCKLGGTHLLQNCRVRVGWINFWRFLFLILSSAAFVVFASASSLLCVFFAVLCPKVSKSVDQSDLDQAYKTN